MQKKTYLFSGHGGCTNRGCEAILRCTLDILGEFSRDVSVNVISKDPESDKGVLQAYSRIDQVYEAFSYGRKFSSKWFKSSISRFVLKGAIRLHLLANYKVYKSADVFIHIGGDNLCYGGEQIWFDELAWARIFGAKTVIWAASIGPFAKETTQRWAKALRQVDLITVRERVTTDYLKSIGVSDNVRLVADPAFLLPVEKIGDQEKRLEKTEGETVVGIGLSSLMLGYGNDNNAYFEAFSNFIQTLLNREQYKIFLIPHVYDAEKGSEDLSVCRRLSKRINHKKLMLWEDHFNACQLKRIIASCDFFIGARTHSTIAAITTNVPTISIGYSSKAYGLNQSIFGHTDYVLPIEKIATSTLLETFAVVMDNRNAIVKQLKEANAAAKKMALTSGQYFREIFHHGM